MTWIYANCEHCTGMLIVRRKPAATAAGNFDLVNCPHCNHLTVVDFPKTRHRPAAARQNDPPETLPPPHPLALIAGSAAGVAVVALVVVVLLTVAESSDLLIPISICGLSTAVAFAAFGLNILIGIRRDIAADRKITEAGRKLNAGHIAFLNADDRDFLRAHARLRLRIDREIETGGD